jgi:hypothetical protein
MQVLGLAPRRPQSGVSVFLLNLPPLIKEERLSSVEETV